MPIIFYSPINLENIYNDLDISSFLSFYKVGNLVSKLSNNSSDNILPIEEITYDKNKNLKLTNFFNKKDKLSTEYKLKNKEKIENDKIKIDKLSNYTNEINIIIDKSKINYKKENDDTSTKVSDNISKSRKRKNINKKEEDYLMKFLFRQKKK
jgi:hypothetical protein